MFLLVLYLVISTLAVACNNGEAATSCENTNCEMVGSTQICTGCKQNFVPINGRCQDAAGAIDKCTKNAGGTDKADQTCGKCLSTTFMYKNGCYDKEGEIGRVICKTPGDTPGVCEACADGYYKDPSPANTKDSCTKCGDENCATCATGTDTNKCTKCAEGYFVGASGSEGPCISCSSTSAGPDSYKGVTGCAKCTKPKTAGAATCTECGTDLYLKTETDGSTSCVTECPTGYFGHTASDTKKKTCQSCSGKNPDLTPAGAGVDGCAVCTYDNTKVTCTKCGTGKYLKADGTCADSCTANTEFVKNDPSNGNKCVSCGDTNAGVPNCAKCSPPSSAGGKPTCSECGSGFKLEGEACVPADTNLSAGAIAGISVAAVVVVGGLVGFLCWWFICRGKA